MRRVYKRKKRNKENGDAVAAPPAVPGHPMLQLQEQAGNQAVQNLLRSGRIQAKLTVGNLSDPDECEADQIANHVMRSHGQPLDPAALAYFEARFGHDFSGVRVHTGRDAEESARLINASAYTLGEHIFFGGAQYRPSSSDGRRLLAHELTHVVHQASAPAARIRRIVELRPPGRGEASAFDRRQELIDRINGLSTGVSYRLSGQRITYTVTNAANATPFDRQMEGFIDRAEVVPLRLITSAGRVLGPGGFQSLLVDFFDAGYLDLDDMRASDDNSFKMNLLHLLAERFAVPNYERRTGTNFSQAEFDRAHAVGLQAETQYLRDTIGDPTIRFVFEETKPDGITLVFGYRSAEGYSIFHVFRRTQQAVSGGHVFAQTRDNRHISVDDLIRERAAARAAGAGGGGP